MKCMFEVLIWLGSVDAVIVFQRGLEDCKSRVREATFMMHVERCCLLGPHTAARIFNKAAAYEWCVPSCAETTGL